MINKLTDDAKDMEQLANVLCEQKGFLTEHIIILRTGEATRDRIVTAMGKLAECVSSNDIVIVRFSDEEVIDEEINWWLNYLDQKARCIW